MKIYTAKSLILTCSIFLIFQQNTSAQNINEGSTRDNYGTLNNCGSRATAPVTCNFSPYYQGVKGKNKLSQLCKSENFGAIEPKVLFRTRKEYKLREHINIEYEGACPHKTEFLIVNSNNPYDTRRNGGMYGRSVRVPSYKGKMTFQNKYIPTIEGSYAIQAYYVDKQGVAAVGGRSLPFIVKN